MSFSGRRSWALSEKSPKSVSWPRVPNTNEMVAFRDIRGCGLEESARCDVLCHCRAAHCPMRWASYNTINSQDHASAGFAITNTARFWHVLSFVEDEIAEHITCVKNWACPAAQECAYHVQIPTAALIETLQTCSAMHGGCLVTPSVRRITLRLASGKSWHRHAGCGFQSQQPLLCDIFKTFEGLSRVSFLAGDDCVTIVNTFWRDKERHGKGSW